MATVNGVNKKYAKVFYNEVIAVHGEYDFSEGAECNLEGSEKYAEIVGAYKNELFAASNSYEFLRKNAKTFGMSVLTMNEWEKYHVLSHAIDEMIEKLAA